LALPCYLTCRIANNPDLEGDIERWAKVVGTQSQGLGRFVRLGRMEEFRTLVRYRVPAARIFVRLLGSSCPALYINTPNIGPGLFLQHAFATIIHARSIGKNCWINQQVTIGFNGAGKHPTIGDNVTVRAGAKVLGDITIGDNVVIGAGAVVVKDVPANCTVVGVPARIVKRNGIRLAPNEFDDPPNPPR
jgi:serine O-acetyltransferase